jgi:hypothetical protein
MWMCIPISGSRDVAPLPDIAAAAASTRAGHGA